jgi:hypothetical protein
MSIRSRMPISIKKNLLFSHSGILIINSCCSSLYNRLIFRSNKMYFP